MTGPAVAPARVWNSWNPVYPAEYVHLSGGIHLGFCAYSDAEGRFTRFAPGGEAVQLGPRSLDGATAGLALEHAGTALDVWFDKPDPDTVRLSWRRTQAGEWGLRFWVLACVWREGGGVWRYDDGDASLRLAAGGRTFLMRGERPPLLATFHPDLDALAAEMETEGYFCLDSRGERGPLAVFRYNLEEMPEFTVAMSCGASRKAASAAVDASLAGGDTPETPALQTGQAEGALDAVRDVIGWNTVWDAANRRPYTSLSRNWVAQKFGGWGVWLDDVLYHGLLAGMLDPAIARENLAAVFAGATPAGNLPCLLTGRDSWLDRSQPPIGAFVVWMLYLRGGDRSLLDMSYDVLRANHEWWWRERDGNGNGLLEYGTSAVGSGLYRGTALGARNESMMDNSPVHDGARLDPDSRTLDCEDVALNSLLALDAELLAKIAAALGHSDAAGNFARRGAALGDRIAETLWDPHRRVFANRRWSGEFVAALAPTSFFPLICGAATPEQAEALVADHLLNEQEFWGEVVLPAVARDHPSFHDNVYWRGRVWPPLNFVVYYGLVRYGFDEVASDLARRSAALFMAAWREGRYCAENYNGETGRADDQPDTDLFYSWGALLAGLGVAGLMDVNPWEGWAFANPGQGNHTLGPIAGPAGHARLEITDGRANLSVDGRMRLRTTVVGRFRHLVLGEDRVSLQIPAGQGGRLDLPALPAGRITAARLGDQALAAASDGGGVTLDLPASDGPLTLSVEIAGD